MQKHGNLVIFFYETAKHINIKQTINYFFLFAELVFSSYIFNFS